MHEVDTGVGWKHTNYRNMRAEVTRSRELVIQTVSLFPHLHITCRRLTLTFIDYDHLQL
jgi:Cu2+-containing amine oxidase